MSIRPDSERAQLLAAMVDSVEVAIVTKTLEGVITTWNPAAARLFGFSAEEAIGRHISFLVPPEKGVEESQILETIRRGEKVPETETIRLRKDGSRVDVMITVWPIRDPAGHVIGAVKMARELTSIRLLQQRAQDQREQIGITLASIADGILVTNEQGQVTFLNPAAEALTGWTLDEARGEPLERVFHIINEHTRRRAENPVPKVLQDGVVTGLANHTVLVSRNGQERAIDDSAAPIRRDDGAISGAVLIFRDVSPSRVADEMRARLAAIVESSDDAIISKDLQGRITSWNRGAERLFEYTPAEMIDRHISMIIPPLNLREETEILERIRRGERIHHFETVRVTKSGKMIDVSISVSPIRNAEGMVIGASKIARDITAQRQIQQALKEAKESLEKAVATRTLELRDAVTDLEHFSYSMSHDLRSMLRNIASYASILLRDRRQQLDPEAQGWLQRILSSSERMDRLMHDALEYCRVAHETIQLAPVDLNRLVAELLQHPPLPSDGAEIQVARPLLSVVGNEGLLDRCLSNFLGNALKFVEMGTVPHVRIWTEEHHDQVRVCVQDNGIGIPSEDLQRVWRIFERGHERKRYEGSGVGLGLVKRAVDKMGGTVGVQSQPGKGSTFWLELRKADS